MYLIILSDFCPTRTAKEKRLALCWHMLGLLGQEQWSNIEPTVGNQVGPMSKMTSGQCHLSTSSQHNANVGPTIDCYLSINHRRLHGLTDGQTTDDQISSIERSTKRDKKEIKYQFKC